MEIKEVTEKELEKILSATEEELEEMFDETPTQISNETFFFDKGILFLEEICENTKNLISDIHFLNLKNKELPDDQKLDKIILKINSEGGCISTALNLIDEIRLSEIPVVGIVEGFCASSAVPVFLSCHERLYRENSTFLIHEQSLKIPDFMKYSQMKYYMDFSKQKFKVFKNIILENSNLTEDKLKKLLKQPDRFLSTERAEKIGLLAKCQKQKNY
jgi:ATP-dependent protease ClpP protease subunit